MNTKKLYIYKLISMFLPESRAFGLKNALLRWAGAEIGRNVRICSSVNIVGNGYLKIEDDVWIGSGTRLVSVAPAGICIGSCVDIAAEVLILTGSHAIDPSGEHVAGKGIELPVKISNGCWIGARSIILPNIELASKTLVAAGAIVTQSIVDSGSLIAGVPARIKRKIDT